VKIRSLIAGKCGTGTFSCDNGSKCIPKQFVCNHIIDCVDESDEDKIECGMLEIVKLKLFSIYSHFSILNFLDFKPFSIVNPFFDKPMSFMKLFLYVCSNS
jgi:hypothetical protein